MQEFAGRVELANRNVFGVRLVAVAGQERFRLATRGAVDFTANDGQNADDEQDQDAEDDHTHDRTAKTYSGTTSFNHSLKDTEVLI